MDEKVIRNTNRGCAGPIGVQGSGGLQAAIFVNKKQEPRARLENCQAPSLHCKALFSHNQHFCLRALGSRPIAKISGLQDPFFDPLACSRPCIMTAREP